ncbi:hypothetical protein SCP_1400800 [Sparassis crispa]|uniref:Uncharacterized protein n=1 Tax=Sparassis crispa TaxID=139825 RepID=A0A401H2L4_9APHY|nr:hypothetical protein SCP_1400800 [Sparassis crispa]GBE88675.1 hypothetical protein SCP_1400800 [Sparassis crispa]
MSPAARASRRRRPAHTVALMSVSRVSFSSTGATSEAVGCVKYEVELKQGTTVLHEDADEGYKVILGPADQTENEAITSYLVHMDKLYDFLAKRNATRDALCAQLLGYALCAKHASARAAEQLNAITTELKAAEAAAVQLKKVKQAFAAGDYDRLGQLLD